MGRKIFLKRHIKEIKGNTDKIVKTHKLYLNSESKEMPMVTGEEVKNTMIEKNITRVMHHDCSICGVWTKYIRRGDVLYYDSSCDCGYNGPESFTERDWDDIADWINMQTNEEARNRILIKVGLLDKE